MLSDSISDSISTILEAVGKYNDYSPVHKVDIVESLSSLYHTMFNIMRMGLPEDSNKDLSFCRKIALKKFNQYYQGYFDNDYEHCEDCYCDLCLYKGDNNHDRQFFSHKGCQGNYCKN